MFLFFPSLNTELVAFAGECLAAPTTHSGGVKIALAVTRSPPGASSTSFTLRSEEVPFDAAKDIFVFVASINSTFYPFFRDIIDDECKTCKVL